MFISNFKKISTAGFFAIIVILIVEIESFGLLKISEFFCRGGELIKMDTDFLCKNLCDYKEKPLSKEYEPLRAKSWDEIKKAGPYDVIVFGSSVGATGWVEMLRRNYKLKVCNMSVHRKSPGRLPEELANIIYNYEKINGNKKAILIYSDLTKRFIDYRMWNKLELTAEKEKELHSLKKIEFHPFSRKLFDLIKTKNKNGTREILIGEKKELFYIEDLRSLSVNIPYSKSNYLKVNKLFKDYQSILDSKGHRLAIITFPTKAQMYEWLLEKPSPDSYPVRASLNFLKNISKTNHIPLLDMEEKLTPHATHLFQTKNQLLWPRAGTHINELGAKLSSQIIYDFLSTQFPDLAIEN